MNLEQLREMVQVVKALKEQKQANNETIMKLLDKVQEQQRLIEWILAENEIQNLYMHNLQAIIRYHTQEEYHRSYLDGMGSYMEQHRKRQKDRLQKIFGHKHEFSEDDKSTLSMILGDKLELFLDYCAKFSSAIEKVAALYDDENGCNQTIQTIFGYIFKKQTKESLRPNIEAAMDQCSKLWDQVNDTLRTTSVPLGEISSILNQMRDLVYHIK